MKLYAKGLFIFLIAGVSIFFAQSIVLSSESLSKEQEIKTTQGLANEQGLSENNVQAREPNLPVDNTARLKVKELVISGNTLISTKNILKHVPEIYNLSDKSVYDAPSEKLYDFRNIRELISDPNKPHEVSLRTVEGLVQYILSLYQKKHYAGIYVYIPQNSIVQGQGFKNDILHIEILEVPVSDVKSKFHSIDQNEVDKSYLRPSVVEKWSPVQKDNVINEKKLDDFVNLLNRNPDRHVYSIISKGNEPNTLSLTYDIYEANPWHYFIQVDNSGTHDRQWTPRAGFINTNFLGFDDRFTVVYQAKPDSTFDENYSVYGSYDIPVMGPKLRLNLFGGHSEFDIMPEGGPFNFLGRGTVYGALLRYNLLQRNKLFFDVTGSYSRERSKVTPSLFPSAGSDIDMDMAGLGVELSRSEDVSNTSLAFNISKSIGGSSDEKFNLARTNADSDFSIYTLSASHSQYLDSNKYEQLRSTIRWITSDERLVPAKMTSFGGMYSVRGYDEYEIVADGGILASVQCEFDLLKYLAATEPNESQAPAESAKAKKNNIELKKLSPLVFFDYGRAMIKDPVAGEKENQNLYSAGTGVSFGIGKNFSGACYYGYPLKATEDTRVGKGRVSVIFMLRW
jgi:hemolysin activation/secretion protein